MEYWVSHLRTAKLYSNLCAARPLSHHPKTLAPLTESRFSRPHQVVRVRLEDGQAAFSPQDAQFCGKSSADINTLQEPPCCVVFLYILIHDKYLTGCSVPGVVGRSQVDCAAGLLGLPDDGDWEEGVSKAEELVGRVRGDWPRRSSRPLAKRLNPFLEYVKGRQ